MQQLLYAPCSLVQVLRPTNFTLSLLSDFSEERSQLVCALHGFAWLCMALHVKSCQFVMSCRICRPGSRPACARSA